MPPEDLVLPRFAAEPPQALLPSGAWSQQLTQEFLSACLRIRSGGLGDPAEVEFYPDRTWSGRTYVPATCMTDDRELFGLVSFLPAFEDGEQPSHFAATADWTQETAQSNPDWTIDFCDEVVGGWRGSLGEVAAMTAVWGRALDPGASRTAKVASAELAGVVVDQCILLDGLFTLLAPDDYLGQTLEIALYDSDGRELARESLYAEDENAA